MPFSLSSVSVSITSCIESVDNVIRRRVYSVRFRIKMPILSFASQKFHPCCFPRFPSQTRKLVYFSPATAVAAVHPFTEIGQIFQKPRKEYVKISKTLPAEQVPPDLSRSWHLRRLLFQKSVTVLPRDPRLLNVF